VTAFPAAQADNGQSQEQGHLTVVQGRGRPSKEQIEALRAEVEAKLKALNVYEATVEHAGKQDWGKPGSWNKRACEAALAYGRKLAGVVMCACGQPAHHYPEDDGQPMCDDCQAVQAKFMQDEALAATAISLMLDFLCDCCGVAQGTFVGTGYRRCEDCLVGVSALPEVVKPGEGPWLDGPTLFYVFHPVEFMDPECADWWALETSRAWGGFRGITGELASLRAALALVMEECRKLRLELADAFDDLRRFNDIKRLSEDESYDANLDQLYIVMSIDNGKAVRDIAHGVQGVIFDAKRRNVVNYKGEVGAKLAISFDKDTRPSECDVAIVTCEVSQKVPAAVCGSRIGLDTNGKVVAPREFFQNLPLGQA